ncbi:hypothetical protein [Nostoc sp.]|uniref:hypothetical protein n=1 Tax=Nostoc sp. TaxID=1180 RepID=UPI003FA607F0
MKPKLICATRLNLRLMGVMPIALSLVLYPAIVKAELTSENVLISDSPLQTDKGMEDPDFSGDVENLSPTSAGKALNSPHSLVERGARGLDSALIFSDDVKSQVEDQADQNKVAEKSLDSNSLHLLRSSEQQFSPLEFTSTSSAPTTDTSIPDVQSTETKIQPFQPATSIDLPRGLRKIAGVEDKNDARKDTETQFPASSTEIQPFQPATSVGLPRGLRKIAGVEDTGTQGQGMDKNLPLSPTPPLFHSRHFYSN